MTDTAAPQAPVTMSEVANNDEVHELKIDLPAPAVITEVKVSDVASVLTEVKTLFGLATPIMVQSMLAFLMNLVDMAMVGNLGTEELASAALGNTFFNTLQHPMVGCSLALDTLLSQSLGADQLGSYGQWTLTGLLAISALCMPFAILLSLTEPILVAFGQDARMSEGAGEFCMHLIPGILPFFWFLCLTKYLQAQGILAPSVVIGLAANLFNGAANWFLIYELDLGFRGAPMATSLSRWAQFLVLLGYVYVTRRHHPTFPSCRVDAKCANMRSRTAKFLRLGAPGALMLGLEAWSFEITTFLAAYLGTISVDAHVILLNIIGFTYMSLPFALGIAASIRVGYLLGAGRTMAAQAASKATCCLMLGFMISLSVIKMAIRDYLGLIFTDDEQVVQKVAGLVHIVVIFQVSDGVQAAVGGVMRGMGHQKIVAAMNFVGFWVVGVVLGSALTFGAGMGVAGLWWGLAAGLTCTATIGVAVVLRTNWAAEAEAAWQRINVKSEAVTTGNTTPPLEKQIEPSSPPIV